MPTRTEHGAGVRAGAVAACGRRGFSLIEILISVLILALGLLGLGAIFPVVVRQQGSSREEVMGVLAGNSAVSQLHGLSALNRDYWLRFANGNDLRFGTSDDPGNRLGLGNLNDPDNPNDDDRWWNGAGTRAENEDGILRLPIVPDTDPSSPDIPVEFLVQERLFPMDGRSNPEFVWDFMVHRIDQGPHYGGLRVAVFVRRLDPGMRLDRDVSLLRALLDTSLPAADYRRPVADSENGTPTFDGRGEVYSRPRQVQLRLVPSDPRRLLLPPGNSPNPGLVAQVGQKLVDKYGTIYTVTGTVREGNDRFVTISPPVSQATREALGIRLDMYVAMTPQIPAHVQVFEVTP